MSRLLIVRHAIALDRDEAHERQLDDADRPLTDKGRQRMIQGAAGIRVAAGPLEQILSSPLSRAQQTGEILRHEYPNTPLTLINHLRPGQDISALITTLADTVNQGTLAVVGHEPDLSQLISTLLCGNLQPAFRLKKGGAALLDFHKEIGRGQGILLWLLNPGQIRTLGGSRSMTPPESLAAQPLAQGLIHLLREQSTAIDSECNRFLSSGDTESLHDLRVAMRRLRALFSGFSPCFSTDTSLPKKLRSLQQSTNTARDLEVGLALVDKWPLTLPGLRQQWQVQLDEEYRRLSEYVPARWQEISRELQTPERLLERTLPSTSLGAFTAAMEAKETKKLLVEIKSLNRKWSKRRAHNLRIHSKRARYLLDPYLDESQAVAAAVTPLKRLQDLLGEYNDIVVLRQTIRASLHHNLLSDSDRPRQAERLLKQRAKKLRKLFLHDYTGKRERCLQHTLHQAGDSLAHT